ncbi:hypothetical protein CEJ87_02135, partial [Caldifermentibacillus hisashii]
MKRYVDYYEIHRLFEEGFSKRSIAKKLGIPRNRVIKYLDMSIEEFEDFSISLKTRKRKLDSYKDKILLWLREHPDMSSAQVYDWLQEKLGVKNIAENTVRNYVNDLREIYHIPKVNPSRTCVWQNKSAELCKGKMQSP